MPSYADAVTLFKDALALAQVTQGSHVAWATTYVNLGTALRKIGYVDVFRIPVYACRHYLG